MPISVVAFLSIVPGREDAFVAAANRCIAESRKEPGVIRYDLWRESQGERRFVFNELYVDQDAVGSHMASSHFAEIGVAIRDLALAAPTIIVSEAVDVAGER